MKQEPLHITLAVLEPPQGLYDAIMARIKLAQRGAARRRAGLFGVFTALCVAAFAPVLQYTMEQLYVSGFNEYLSFVATDHFMALTYWREFSLTLLESLPSVAFVTLLLFMAALLWSLIRLVQNVRGAFRFA